MNKRYFLTMAGIAALALPYTMKISWAAGKQPASPIADNEKPPVVVTYSAPTGELLSTVYEVTANGRKVDAYTTIRGASRWTIVPRNSRYVTIRGVKICGSRVQNDDGINPCNSRDVLITDCFIRSDDDCVALKGIDVATANSNVERITVENSVLWCDRARVFLLGHESRAAFMRQVALRAIDIIHFTMTPFLFEPGEDMRLEDITVENVRLHGEGQHQFICLNPVVNQYMQKKVPGFVRNVRFRNVTIECAAGEYLVQLCFREKWRIDEQT